MFEIFNDQNYRQDLLKAIEQPGYDAQTPKVRDLVSHAEFRNDRQRFSTTFEWFVGELLVRRFQAFSSSFGAVVQDVVRNSDGGTSGDYDVLSVLGDMNLLYLECKTGKCRQHSILNSIDRSIGLHSVACVIFLGGGLSADTLKRQLADVSHPRFKYSDRLRRISIKGVPDSEIYQWFDCYFVGAGETEGDAEKRLRTVMRILAAQRSSVFETTKPNPEDYAIMGYEYTEVVV
jgi:hypothetical protein